MPFLQEVRRVLLADSSSTGTGIGGSGRFALPSKGTLVFASCSVTGLNTGPVRVNILLDFDRSQANLVPLTDAVWLRGDSNYGFRETAIFTGTMPLEGRNIDILVNARNDSGAAATIVITWMVIP